MFIAASCLSAYNTVGRTAEGSETKAADAQAHTDELAQIKADLEENGER